MSKLDSGQILELNGNVHFYYGDTQFKSDRALILDGPKIARLSGRVAVSNDSLNLVADSLAYYRIPQILNLGGRVRITQTTAEGNTRWYQGDYGIYDQANDTFTTWSNVRAYDQQENAQSSCGYAFWDRRAGYSYLIESPVVSAGTTDILTVKADKMEFFEQERKLIATFNVDVRSGEYHATSDFLIYFSEEEKAVFIGEPRFDNPIANAEAKEFQIWFKDRKPTQAVLMDSCYVRFSSKEDLPRTNWVKAQNVILNFTGDEIRDFTAENEVSYYFVQDQEGNKDYFINTATGEYLEAKFSEDNELQIMNMRGGIKGSYKFKNDS